MKEGLIHQALVGDPGAIAELASKGLVLIEVVESPKVDPVWGDLSKRK